MDDPMSHFGSEVASEAPPFDQQSHEDPLSQLEEGCLMHLTSNGIRVTLNRPIRPKPLLSIPCSGCDRTSHSPDTYIPGDFLEWQGGYYKLTKRMKSLGISDPQPTGPLCKDCAEVIRRGYPTLKKDAVVKRLQNDPVFKQGEFHRNRLAYIADVEEKIRFGNSRLKKRAKTVKKTDALVISNKLTGVMVDPVRYREAASRRPTTLKMLFLLLNARPEEQM